MLITIVALSFAAGCSHHVAVVPPANGLPAAGAEGAVTKQYACVAVSDFYAMKNEEAENDGQGLMKMAMDHQIFQLQDGDDVKVTGYDPSQKAWRIHVLSGQYTGQDGWVGDSLTLH